MTATYTPVATPTDEVRLAIGDTDVLHALLQDEEIAVYLTAEANNTTRAAARAAGAIAARFARLVSTSIGDVSVQAQQQYEHYKELAETLTGQAATGGTVAAAFAGGISLGDVTSRRNDPDRIAPFFSRTTGDNPPVIDAQDTVDR